MSEYQSTLGKIEDSKSEQQKEREAIQDAADAIVDSIQEGVEEMKHALDTRREFNKLARD